MRRTIAGLPPLLRVALGLLAAALTALIGFAVLGDPPASPTATWIARLLWVLAGYRAWGAVGDLVRWLRAPRDGEATD